MNNSPTIRCKKCDSVFPPDMKAKAPWVCPSCQAKNPNLRRHYRSVADLCILGLVVTAIVGAVVYSNAGLTFGVLLSAAHAVLLLVAIVFVYRSKAPWADRAVKALVWTVFGLAFVASVALPLVIYRRLNIPALIAYALVFPYLFWLNSQAGKCTPPDG